MSFNVSMYDFDSRLGEIDVLGEDKLEELLEGIVRLSFQLS